MSREQGEGSAGLTRKVIKKGVRFDFEEVTLREGSKTRTHMVVRHPGSVVVLPVLGPETPRGERRVVFVRNRRLALGEKAYLVELPAGTREPGEDPAVTAARELAEETGYEAATWTPLGRFYTAPGMTDEYMHAYAAEGLRAVGQDLDEDEELTVEVVGVSRALGMIDGGELTDVKSIAALLLGARRGVLGAV